MNQAMANFHRAPDRDETIRLDYRRPRCEADPERLVTVR
jgi:hypothetical protein